MLLRFAVVFIVLGLILMPIQSAHAQAASGTISGEVRDPSGSVVPAVQIKLTEIRTNQEYAHKADQDGFYTILNLMPGSTTPCLNGGRPRTNEYLYDGISVIQPELGQVAFHPIIEAIQEFELEIKSPSAEFGKFTGGWRINSIIYVQSGLPLAVSPETNYNAFARFGALRSNLVENPVLDHPTTAMRFNMATFQTAPQFTRGTSSRNPARAPGVRDMDLALVKWTRPTESVNMEFRSEFFNFANTPPLGATAVVLGTAGFGTITTVLESPSRSICNEDNLLSERKKQWQDWI